MNKIIPTPYYSYMYANSTFLFNNFPIFLKPPNYYLINKAPGPYETITNYWILLKSLASKVK